MTRRIELDTDELGAGLGRLVVAVLEIVRELLERQALRRAESLAPEEVERLGRALMALNERFTELRENLGVSKEDLSLPIEIADLDPSIEMGGRE